MCSEPFVGGDVWLAGGLSEVALEVSGLVGVFVAWDADVGPDPADAGVEVLWVSSCRILVSMPDLGAAPPARPLRVW